ncbi:hypothetical protein [Maribacter sp. 2307ULW6-5]|uniref:hypothetical protein n=1 Tax=Maribacter sp. 2307ULW6-5 TaxID=3386275 RepID=UPI0039BD56F5
MEKQYCRVGSVTPLAATTDAVHLLEHQYQLFLEKASMMKNTQLGEFFENKAQKIKKALENLV